MGHPVVVNDEGLLTEKPKPQLSSRSIFQHDSVFPQFRVVCSSRRISPVVEIHRSFVSVESGRRERRQGQSGTTASCLDDLGAWLFRYGGQKTRASYVVSEHW